MSKSRGKRINGVGHRHTKSPTLGGLLTTNEKWKIVNGVLSGAMHAGDPIAVSKQDLRL